MTAGIDAAYASCERIARSHYENFPVASILVPARMRRHLAAVYAFARAADDFADEGEWTREQRLRLLDGWDERLRCAVAGTGQRCAGPGEPENAPAIFEAVGHSIRECLLPDELFADLLSAFRQDVTVQRYQDWDALFDYARRSANPVGRLVLRIAGYRDTTLDAWSDAVCTALQFTNFWQDVHVDARRGRIYLPQSELPEEAAIERDLQAGVLSPAIRRALHGAVDRTRPLFLTGRPLCDAVGGRLRYELRATWLGGVRILDRVERQLGSRAPVRPALGPGDAPWLAWRLITWAPQ